MRRSLASVAAAVALAGCPSSHDDAPPGSDLGAACSSERECRAGLVCSAGACAAVYAQAPSCPQPVIVAGPPVGPQNDPGCITPVRTPVVSPGEVLTDLGELPVGATATFDVPAGTSAFSILSQEVGSSAPNTLVYQGYTLPNTVVPTDVLRPPGGALFFSDTDPLPSDAHGYPELTSVLAYYSGFTPVVGAFSVPNTSAALDLVRSAGELPSGSWSFQVNDWAHECLSIPGCSVGGSMGTYRVQVVTRAGGLRSTGTLDLEIYLATDPLYSSLRSASEAASSPQVARMVRDLAAYTAQAGVCVGEVTFHDLPSWARSRLAPNGSVDITGSPPCDDLSQLFTLSLAQRDAVHLFLADSLYAGPQTSGRMVLGVDGAIPGPSGFPGTITSGAIVGLFDLLGDELAPGACAGATSDLANCGTDLVAYVAAHEAGHWLGLYHTTEATGDLFDPLADTARCTCLSCAPISERATCSELGMADTPAVMEAKSCAGSGDPCGGATNLMFWLVDDTISRGELTPQQGEVVRLNPAVH